MAERGDRNPKIVPYLFHISLTVSYKAVLISIIDIYVSPLSLPPYLQPSVSQAQVLILK